MSSKSENDALKIVKAELIQLHNDFISPWRARKSDYDQESMYSVANEHLMTVENQINSKSVKFFNRFLKLNAFKYKSSLNPDSKIERPLVNNIYVLLEITSHSLKYSNEILKLGKDESTVSQLDDLSDDLKRIREKIVTLLMSRGSFTTFDYDVIFDVNDNVKKGFHLYSWPDGACVHRVSLFNMFDEVEQEISVKKLMAEQSGINISRISGQSTKTKGLSVRGIVFVRYLADCFLWLSGKKRPTFISDIYNAVFNEECSPEEITQSLRSVEKSELPLHLQLRNM